MGIIKEPLNIDFEVENRPLTKEEELKISQYISSQKQEKEVIDKAKRRTPQSKPSNSKSSLQVTNKS